MIRILHFDWSRERAEFSNLAGGQPNETDARLFRRGSPCSRKTIFNFFLRTSEHICNYFHFAVTETKVFKTRRINDRCGRPFVGFFLPFLFLSDTS